MDHDYGSPATAFNPTLPARKLIVISAVLFALGVFIAAGALLDIAGHLDRDENQRGQFYAQQALQTRQAASSRSISGYANWTAAYQHLNGEVDVSWAYAENNLGASLFTRDGYDGVFVMDGALTRYAMIRGQLVSTNASSVLGLSITQLVDTARNQSDPTRPLTRLALYQGWPSIVTAAAILPSDNRPGVDLRHISVLLLVDQLTPAKLERLGNDFGLHELSVSNLPGITDAAQLPLTPTPFKLTWLAANPGKQMLAAMLPPMTVATLLLGILLLYYLRVALRSTREVDAGYRRLGNTLQALETSEDRFRAVAEASSDWIWEIDAEQRMTYLSARFAQVTGYREENWLGQPLDQLLSCETTPLGPWLLSLDGRSSVTQLRCSYRDQSGQLRYTRLSARAVIHEGDVQGFRGTASDITDEVAAHAQIQHLSLHDALTGLPNRNKLARYLGDALALHENAAPLTLLLLNLDNFKPINDSLGHPAGDAVLMEVASRLRDSMRDQDLLARLGGDEFVIVLHSMHQQVEIDCFCQRLIESLRQPISWQEQALHVGASLGIAQSGPQGHEAEELIRCADIALYQAKAAGRNTWRYFVAQMNERIQHRRQLENELRQAIAQEQFVLHFQPRYQIDTLRIVSVEALVRWNHPLEGLKGPDSFIPLAEQTDLIVPLGRWVMREACETARQWPANIAVSVNLSPAQFSRSDVVKDVREVLVMTRFPAARLELEITENVMLNDVDGALATMTALKELGVRLNMDDFGTGYSSLGYLRTYPFDGIKIDKRFIAALSNGGSDRAVVQAIITLGKAMGLTVTAEGVETQQQLDILGIDQCHEAQGYFLSRPIDKHAFAALLKQQPDAEGQRRLSQVKQARTHAR